MLRTARHIYRNGCSHLRHRKLLIAPLGVPSVGPDLHHQLQLPYQRECLCKLHTSATSFSNRDPEPGRMRVISIPNPFRWLHNQIELAGLRRDWDPNFSIETFKYGVRQAVCTCTDLITRREWGELRGLLSQKAITKLRAMHWSPDQMNNLVLDPSRIQVTQVDNVSLQTIVDRKYCDIDLTVIGTKDPYNLHQHSLVVLEYFVRFHREYTDDVLPDWSITVFKLKNFEAYPRRSLQNEK